ncbi:MAG: glucose-6-phosphate isomerase [Chloroflexi bacterium]|nr:glucose-6-phosphate isomerase [Chloroflexota bacterium]
MSPAKPSADRILARTLDDLKTQNTVARIWQKDHTVWKPDPTELANRLGWLDVADRVLAELPALNAFVAEMRAAGYTDAVLLGMGGSSLAPEVMRRTFRVKRGYLRLHVLDSTVPGWVAGLTHKLDPERTLFIVSSKSGGTIEVMSFFKHFWAWCGPDAGAHFVAVTDPDTSLQKLATERGFRKVFVNDPNIGGRYSAQSYFGLAPAALMGIDVGELLRRVQLMMGRCAPAAPLGENPGATLGAVLGSLALAGRDKLTFIMSPAIASFGLWAEQLVAESTGKEGKGILPIALEPTAPASAYGRDRLFAYLKLEGDDSARTDRLATALEKAGQPVIRIDLQDRYDIASEWYRWEFATAVAGAVLGIQPFDQPNVQESKDITGRVLVDVKTSGVTPVTDTTGDLKAMLAKTKRGAYVALMAYIPQSPVVEEALDGLRLKLLKKYGLPNTMGYGPRFLHSTGQYHKGGPNTGVFVQLVADWGADVPIPGESYTFKGLAAAQCVGDFEALRKHDRRVVRVNLGRNAAQGIRELTKQI